MVKKSSTSKVSKPSGSHLILKIVLVSIPLLIILLFLGVFLAIGPHRARNGFKTLSEMKLYAKLVDEAKATMENNNPVKPEYPKYFASRRKGFFGKRIAKLKSLLKMKVEPWTAETYSTYVEALGKARKEKGVLGNPVHKINLTPTSKIVIWGDLQGAFHSLVRGLEHLESIGVIGDDLKLKSGDDYIVFLGDVVSRSAFCMETVTVVCALMAANPLNVVYIRGNHESNNYWHDYGFKDELQAKASYLSAETIPLETITNAFFATVPVAAYFGMPPEINSSFLKMCHESTNDANRVAKIDEPKLIKFLTTPCDQKLSNTNLEQLPADSTPCPNKFVVRACVKSEIKRDSYQAMDGMRQTLPESGASTWTMLSCPTETYQKGLSFFFDCFAIISPGATFEAWTIELHKQDARTKDGFKTRKNYLLSGQDAAVGPPPVSAPTPAAPPAAATAAVTPSPAPAVAPPSPVAALPAPAVPPVTQAPPVASTAPAIPPATQAPLVTTSDPATAQAPVIPPTQAATPVVAAPTPPATQPAAAQPSDPTTTQVPAPSPAANPAPVAPVAVPTAATPSPVAASDQAPAQPTAPPPSSAPTSDPSAAAVQAPAPPVAAQPSAPVTSPAPSASPATSAKQSVEPGW